MTYDLRSQYIAEGYGEEETAEFDREATIEAIEDGIRAAGHEPDRIGHIRDLARRLVAGDRWDLVFNIAEGLRGVGREAQVPALLEAYDIPGTFSDTMVLALALHKGMTKRVIRDLGLPTPDFAVVETPADAERVALPYPLFVKPVQEGTGKGIAGASKIATREQLLERCRETIAQYRQPALVETYLPGREFTVGVIGTGERARAVGVMEVIFTENAESDVYSYINKEEYHDRIAYRMVDGPIAEEAKALVLAAWRGLGCRDAGRLDVRAAADGRLHFIEVNPLAGLHPQHSDLPMICTGVGIPYNQLIAEIVESAAQRVERK